MTQKTLKDLFEVYKPKSPDEQKFVDKHVTIKHKDRNGNGDDVFNGNTKYIKRKEERHGYDVNDDEKVYEEVEEIEELSKATLGSYAKKAKDQMSRSDTIAGREMGSRYDGQRPSPTERMHNQRADKRYRGLDMAINKLAKEEAELEEKKLTPAEMKKREEIAKAMERENPGMDKSKKMAIATATAKRVAEEAEELDEISAATLRSYTGKASDARGHRNLSTAKLDKRYSGVALAHEKIRARHAKVPANEEVENVEEAMGDVTVTNISAADAFKKRTGQLTSKSTVPVDPKTGKTLYQKMTKEDIINKAIEKFMPELEDYVPMTQEEKLVAKIEHLPEAHIHTLLSLYESLNEDNRNKMMSAVDTQEGINGLIDFAIQNRGE